MVPACWPAGPSPLPRLPVVVELISLDVGGVLVVPDHGFLALALARAGVEHDPEAFWEAHYRAMHAVDAARSDPESFGDYLDGFLAAIGVPEARWSAARAELDPIFHTPLWAQPVPGSRAGVRALAEAGVRLAVTSNSDGTVEPLLRRNELVQVGEGPGTPVEVIVDSGRVGVAKPDPAIFTHTCEATGVPPERVLHVGDSVHYDVRGAEAAGVLAVHFDPHGLCPDGSHAHVAALVELRGLLDRGAG